MWRWKKPLPEVLDRERSGGGSGYVTVEEGWSSSREWSGLVGRELGREPGRDPGRDVGFEPGGVEVCASRLRLLSSSESTQLRWSSGCSSSTMTPAGEAGVVTGVVEPELRREFRREDGRLDEAELGFELIVPMLRPAREKLECPRPGPGDVGRDPGGELCGLPTPGVPA